MIGKAISNKCLPVGRHHRSLVILLFNLTVGSYPEITALIPNCHAPESCPFLHGNPVDSQVGASSSALILLRIFTSSRSFYLFLFSCRQLSTWEVEIYSKTMVWIGLLWLQCIELAFATLLPNKWLTSLGPQENGRALVVAFLFSPLAKQNLAFFSLTYLPFSPTPPFFQGIL